LQQRIEPNEARIAFGLQHVRPRADAVLVTHAHFDHLLDVPEIMRRTNARLVAGVTAANLTMSCGVDRTRCLIVQPGSTRLIGPWRIRVLPAAHDRILGWLPFRGTRSQPGTCPAKASDWRLGEPMAFLIEASASTLIPEEHLRFCRRLKSRRSILPFSAWLYPTAENDFTLPSTGSAQGMFCPVIRMTSLPRSNADLLSGN